MQSLSLFLSLFTFAKTVWIQIRPEWNSGKNVSSIKKMCSCAIESTQSVVQKPMRTIKWVLSVYIVRSHAGIQRGEFLSNTGPYPLKFSKLPSQHSTLGHHRHASETPFKGVSLAGRWWPAFSDIWILSPLKKDKKTLSEFGYRSDLNGIQKSMFFHFKHLGMR